ncbi:MAG TPA: UPF0182 family protein [Acidimicrobiia bacterium]|nr:UPF0182 family protein [Acidimicrobiia bacterium]
MRVTPAKGRRTRLRGWLIAAAVVLLVLLFSLRGLAGFYTDSLWFDSLGQGGTWERLLAARVVPALVFTVLFFAILLLSLIIADRLAPTSRLATAQTPEDELIDRYRQLTARFRGRIRVGVALFFALIAGIGVSSQWRDWLLFTNGTDTGTTDPQFGKDIGFYLFKLPFINFIIDWLFAGLVIVLLVTAVAHYLNGGIRFQSTVERVTPQVKAHLSVILAIMALVKTAEYYFSRFDLNLSNRGVVDGASYTDVNAQLPALKLLIFVSVIAALLFVWNIRRRGWVLPVIAVGLWGFVSLVVATIYPAAIQNFRVKPNEFANERKFIDRNIAATRESFDLAKVDVKNFDFTGDVAPEVVEANLATIDNARLWDPNVIQDTYSTLQALQTYYRINDVDVDRYDINGQTTQVLLSARELNGSELPSQSWVNEHIVYTHGYGAVASPSNEAQSDGSPVFVLDDIPPVGESLTLSDKGAQIYFGERIDGYVIVDAKSPELNYARQGRNDALTRYTGKDGIVLSNVIRKAAFALRFGDANPLISGQVDGDSRVLMLRGIRERVTKLAPFLDFDADPYPVITEGRTTWILDGYTTSDRYPYAQSFSGSGGLSSTFNYVRNSVKVTVDAYNGTVKFFVIDAKDPVIRAYQKAFPDLFSPFSEMPDELVAHLRYPEDLFKVQSDVFSKYHVTQARRFYTGNERWLLSPDPNSVVGTIPTASPRSTTAQGRSPEISATTKRQDPFYLYIRLPGEDRESFLILQPFVPVSKDNQQTRLVAFMTAKSDPRDYGELDAFVMPQGEQVLGPVQVAANINKDTTISQRITLLDQRGSEVISGNVQLIPVGDSIVYVQPFFTIASQGAEFPQFQFVAVLVQDRAPVIGATVADALAQLFGEAPQAPTPDDTPTTPEGQTVDQLLAQATEKFAAADAALRDGDLGTYQSLVKEAQALVAQAQAILDGTAPTTTTTTSAAAPAAFRR